ncbi:MAG TPA: penicillin-binding protein 2 [Aliidongia sp.]|nr:penicillin-binding protein 2 [Aliidongia sp.]
MKAAPLEDDDNPCRPRHFRPNLTPAGDAAAPAGRSLALGRKRLLVTGGVFLFAFTLICGRLTQVSLLRAPDADLVHLTQPQAQKPVDYPRADIIDRNGVVLATTLESQSLFANPHLVPNAVEAAHGLAKVLPGTKESELLSRLTEDKSFVWLYRHLTPGQQAAVLGLGIPGVDFQREDRRLYPAGPLAAHVVGFTNTDEKGQAGFEHSFESALTSSNKPVQLSIDVRLQAIVKEEMQKTIDDFSAVGAAGLVMDVKTGELLSMVSLPDFDPNDPKSAMVQPAEKGEPAPVYNRSTNALYEMGSVFKIFNTALALDSHKSTLTSIYNTDPIHIGRFIIHDYHPFNRPASVTEIFMESSNIGSARMVMESGPEAQRAFLDKLGLLHPPQIEISDVGVPRVPNPWREINAMTIAYGHGLSVSQLQTAIAANAIVDGGILRPATLLKQPEGYVPPGVRVVTQHTSEEMRKLLRLVVTDGTAKQGGDVPGYLVGGKTGTAEKVFGHGYAKKALLSSFIGVFPINDPQYMVFVTIDEPHGTKKSYGFATAGWTAVPAVSRIIARMAPLFGIKPIEETPEIHRAITIDIPGSSKQVAVN